MNECWTFVPGISYAIVSSAGNVAVARDGKWFIPTIYIDENGYPRFDYWSNNKRVKHRVHSLVAQAFLGERPKGMVVRHLDGNPANNNLDNLCYGTHAENTEDIKRHGRMPLGENRQGAKLTNAQAEEIRTRYSAGGISQSKLATEYGVTQMVVFRITRGRSYA